MSTPLLDPRPSSRPEGCRRGDHRADPTGYRAPIGRESTGPALALVWDSRSGARSDRAARCRSKRVELPEHLHEDLLGRALTRMASTPSRPSSATVAEPLTGQPWLGTYRFPGKTGGRGGGHDREWRGARGGARGRRWEGGGGRPPGRRQAGGGGRGPPRRG